MSEPRLAIMGRRCDGSDPPMASVLVVEDEAKIAETVRLYLSRDGHDVSIAADGREALDAFRRLNPDLIVLDLMLPEIDGLEVCRTIRRSASTPIIMLTARAEEVDRLIGLELGADDYVTKPFSPRELAARVRAVLRRSAGGAGTQVDGRLQVGRLVIDDRRHEALCGERPLDLTPTEFRLLWTMAREPGRAFTRAQLLDLALGERFEGYERTVDAHIKNLRGKIPAGSGCAVSTVYGIGYRLEETDSAPA